MEPSLEQRLRELERTVAGLEKRLSALEGRPPTLAKAPSAAAAETPIGEASGRQLELLMPLAVACFVLAGAFLLRMLSQQGHFDMRTGAWAGLAYCLVLQLAAGLLARRTGPLAPMLCASGMVLAPALVLETHHRWQAMGVAEGAASLALLGLLGCWPALARRSRGLLLLCLVLPVLGIAGLGLGLEALGGRALGWALLGTAALAGSRVLGWRALRHLVLLPVLVFVAVAVLATAHRGGPATGEFIACALAAGLLWLAVLVQHLGAWRRLGPGEAAWLPVLSTWLIALLGFARPGIVAPASLAAGVAVLLVGMGLMPGAAFAGRTGMLAAGLVAALGGGLLLHPEGAAGAAAALLASLAAWRLRSTVLASLAVTATAVALVWGILAGNLSDTEGGAVATCISTAALALVAGLQARLHRMTAARSLGPGFAAMLLATVSLVLLAHCLLVHLLESDDIRTLFGSALLGAAVLGCLLLAARRRERDWQWLGLLLLALLCGKVALLDLAGASGAVAAADAGILGTVLLVSSLIKKRRPPEPSEKPSGTDPE